VALELIGANELVRGKTGFLGIGQFQPLGDAVVAHRIGGEALDQLADGVDHFSANAGQADVPSSRR